MPKELKKSKSTERIWDLKTFKLKTITKKDFEENREDIINIMENLDRIVDKPTLFISKVHCKEFEQFFKVSTKMLRYLDENEINIIEKITKYYKDNCKSIWSAEPKVVIDEDFQ